MSKASQDRRKSPSDDGPEDSPSPAETAASIAPMTGELAGMARKSGLTALAYLLEMAQLEAANVTQSGQG